MSFTNRALLTAASWQLASSFAFDGPNFKQRSTRVNRTVTITNLNEVQDIFKQFNDTLDRTVTISGLNEVQDIFKQFNDTIDRTVTITSLNDVQDIFKQFNDTLDRTVTITGLNDLTNILTQINGVVDTTVTTSSINVPNVTQTNRDVETTLYVTNLNEDSNIVSLRNGDINTDITSTNLNEDTNIVSLRNGDINTDITSTNLNEDTNIVSLRNSDINTDITSTNLNEDSNIVSLRNGDINTDITVTNLNDPLETDVTFWSHKGVNISGWYPAMSDSNSTYAGGAEFNFGQRAFKGDPFGYQPYDTSYDPALWVGGTANATTNYIYPANLKAVYYNKVKTSGKYYFEVEVNPSRLDQIGLLPIATTLPLVSVSNSVYITYGDALATAHIGNGTSYQDVQWSNYNTTRGANPPETWQVYLDYDNGNVMIRKLGTEKDDHVNYLT